MRRLGTVIAVVVCMCVAGGAFAQNTFYCDPVNGSMSGDGSSENPWRTIEEVINAGLINRYTQRDDPMDPGSVVTGGDTILLRSGYHGVIYTVGHSNQYPLTIAADDGHTPQLGYIQMEGGNRWIFRGLTISPSFLPSYQKRTIVDFHSRFSPGGNAQNMTVEDCFIYSVLDASNWSASEWVSKSCNGVNLGFEGADHVARNNRILNVYHGLLCEASAAVAENNEVVNFAGDGCRATMHNVRVENNIIKNCYNVDNNHDDGIQGYFANSSDGEVHNVVLRGNLIIMRESEDQLHHGPLQGIGVFDGPPMYWTVENNVIITDMWHGIALFGGIGHKIINNTAINPFYLRGQSNMNTWIRTDAAKDGTPAQDCVVRNNIANRILTSGNTNLTVDHNISLGSNRSRADDLFVDWENHDLHIKEGSEAVDAGSPTFAPDIDHDQVPRPQDEGIDIGAFEYVDANSVEGVYVFYNNSAFDGYDPAANAADDAAIATDKIPALPGEFSTFANYTNYDKGINGIMLDFSALGGNVTAADFEFVAGNNSLPDGWTSISPSSVSIRSGEGISGSDRVMILFPDYAVMKKWLRITVKATTNTGLFADQVMYIGNAVGDTGDSTTDAIVNSTDEVNCRNNPKNFINPAAVTDAHDFNRDGKVDASDQILARNHTTTFTTALRMMTMP